MKIEAQSITIRELVKDYVDNDEEGVFGYGGKLNIRPKYQREFVYDNQKRDAVIKTVRKGFPLNTMYWVKNSEDSFEILDGQQRTVSICRYVANKFGIDGLMWHNLTSDQQEQILDYKLSVYFCEGTDSEKLDWFEIINIAGEVLTKQELRNVAYTGEWLISAKRYFSKTGGAAYNLAKDYVDGIPIRQVFLETALCWIVKEKDDKKIRDYMSVHQHDSNADELWDYFKNVINWVKEIFPKVRKEMKGIEWGFLYNDYYEKKEFDAKELEKEIVRLIMDDDVTNQKGIYSYLITGDEKYLSIRAFTANQKNAAYAKQEGICPICKKHFEINEMEGDHITPWSEGGHTVPENLQMLCKEDNRRKGKK